MEKAYYGWGTDMTNKMTMIETGLECFVKFDKGDFVGREALLQRKEEGITTKLVYGDKKVVDVTTSGAFGNTVQKSVALAYLNPEFAEQGSTFDIESPGVRCRAMVLAEPACDPRNERLRF